MTAPRSVSIAIGMNGVINAIIPGHATQKQYVKETTMAELDRRA